MKETWIICLLSLLVNTTYSQVNCGAPMPMIEDSTMTFVHGKLQIFPFDSAYRMKDISVCANTVTSRIFSVSVRENGDFWFQIEKNKADTLSIVIYGKPFSRERNYYHLELTNVPMNKDSVYIGVVPAVPDPYGYFAEWGTSVKKNIFDRKVQFWTKEIMYLDKRYKHENKLNIIYNSFCYDCDSIFITETISESKDKNHFWSSETRKLIIDHQEVLAMSEYFTFNYPYYDSLARHFICVMEQMSDSLYYDRFNNAARTYIIDNNKFFTDRHDPILNIENDSTLSDDDLLFIDLVEDDVEDLEENLFTIVGPNLPGLRRGRYAEFKKAVLNTIELSDEEKKRIDNKLLFTMEVDRIGTVINLKLLSLVDSDTRRRLEPVLDKLGYKFIPVSSRGRSYGFIAAFRIDL